MSVLVVLTELEHKKLK